MIWKRNGGNITFISKRGKPMYEKIFLKLMSLLPHSGEKRGILSEKAEEYLLFSQKNIKKVKKKACGFEHFLYFCNQQEKFLPIPPRSLRLL